MALAILIGEVLAHYERAKAARGKLDFDDLIERTLTLLERSDARWVLYKLDSGIDHILVDEAQDTSEAQWKILEELSSEFSVGLGSRNVHRTFFAVGDEKQSIFSFQGAAPHMFHAMRKKLRAALRRRRKLRTCGAEDLVPLGAGRALSGRCGVRARRASKGPGRPSDIWMGHEAAEATSCRASSKSGRSVGANGARGAERLAPAARYSGRDGSREAPGAARRAKDRAASRAQPPANVFTTATPTGFRPIRAGDILILVRTRGPFFDAVIRALKQKTGPGRRRRPAATHRAYRRAGPVAAGRAALLPEDDLNLAAVLKSPLIGLDDDDLLNIAPRRPGSLFEALQRSARDESPGAVQTLARWRARAAASPFAFYSSLLMRGRRAARA